MVDVTTDDNVRWLTVPSGMTLTALFIHDLRIATPQFHNFDFDIKSL